MHSVCPRCQQVTKFEASKEEIAGTGFFYNVVRCRLCKTAIGVVGNYNTDSQLIELREAIRAIALRLGVPVNLSRD